MGRASAENYLVLRCSLASSMSRLSGTTPGERKTFGRSTRVSNENSRSGSQEGIERHHLLLCASSDSFGVKLSREVTRAEKISIISCSTDTRIDGAAMLVVLYRRDLRPWVDRKHGQMNYFLTLFLRGHGSYQAYLRRFGISKTDECNYCNGINKVEQTFFERKDYRACNTNYHRSKYARKLKKLDSSVNYGAKDHGKEREPWKIEAQS
ncbi:hypothetical protein Trydic_g15432 [Trypoxylus dichotomus]